METGPSRLPLLLMHCDEGLCPDYGDSRDQGKGIPEGAASLLK